MILFGCLLAFSAAVAPRLVLILAWIFSDRWPRVWEGDFFLPLLGIIFLPYTTIMYMLTVTLALGGGVQPIQGWDWLWILMGLFLDFMKWSQMLANRKEATKQTQRYYPSGAPKTPTGTGSAAVTGAAVSTGSVQASTSPSAPDAATTGADTNAESPPSDSGSKPSGTGDSS
ncbi:MAG: hypothetical protein ACC726_04655 [Chloroflexota bacterium]